MTTTAKYNRPIPGYDVTFSAAKSISLAALLRGDELVKSKNATPVRWRKVPENSRKQK